MNAIGIDTGPERSAYAFLDDGLPGAHAWLQNDHLLAMLVKGLAKGRVLAIETLHPRGEPVSKQAMDAQLWAGRFIQAAGVPFVCVDERDGRFAASGSQSATAKNVRIGLQNQFGEDRQEPCGNCEATGRIPGNRGRDKNCDCCKGRKFVTVPGPMASFGEHERCALSAALWACTSKIQLQEQPHA